MKTVWHSCWLVLLLVSLAAGYDQIRIDATLDDSTHTISGVTTVSWAGFDSSVTDLHFRLWANRACEKILKLHHDSASICGTIVDSVTVNGRTLPTAVDRTDLTVMLPATVQDSVVASVYFRTALPRQFDRLSYVEKTYYLDGWFPMPEPFRAGRWLIVNYDGEAELVGDFYNFDVTFRSRADLQQIAPGLISSDTANGMVTGHYKLEPAHDFVLAVGREFESKEYTFGHHTLKIWHKEKDVSAIDSIAVAIQNTFAFMAARVAPYPFDELVVLVGVPFSGGVEFPRMYWQAPAQGGAIAHFNEFVAIHETIHEWFYGIVASNQAEDPWMDEAITEYFSWRVTRSLTGAGPSMLDAYGFTANLEAYDRLQGYEMLDQMPITRSSTGYSRNQYFQSIYGKGSMVLMTFGRLLGSQEDNFWHAYYSRYAFKHPTQQDFIDLANQFPPFADKKNAEQILTWNEGLDYRVTDISATKDKDSTTYKSVIHYELRHPMPFPVVMAYTSADGNTIDTTLVPDIGSHTLAVTGATPVVTAQIDPDHTYVVDMNYLNNSFSTNGNGTASRLFSGMTFLVQSLFSWLWGW